MRVLLRLFFRLIGVILALPGLALLVLAVAVFAIGRSGDPLGKVWFDIHHASENLAQAIVQRYIHPALWDPGIVTILNWPSWVGLVLTGFTALIIGWLIIALTTRRKRA